MLNWLNILSKIAKLRVINITRLPHFFFLILPFTSKEVRFTNSRKIPLNVKYDFVGNYSFRFKSRTTDRTKIRTIFIEIRFQWKYERNKYVWKSFIFLKIRNFRVLIFRILTHVSFREKGIVRKLVDWFAWQKRSFAIIKLRTIAFWQAFVIALH